MTSYFRRNFISNLLILMAVLAWPIPGISGPNDPIEKATLPNDQWTYEKPEKTDGSQKIMYVKKTGQAVNLRLHVYPSVPVSSKAFLDQVRLKIMEKPDYKGAEVKLVTSKDLGGWTWDVFSIVRADKINQEIWARKTAPDVVFMLIYTAAGTYYDQYYRDFQSLLSKS